MTGMKKHIRAIVVIAVLLALSVLSVVFCVGIGTIAFTPREVVRAIFVDDGSPARLIIWNLRFPRILTGGLVGICLALAGCVLQGVMRNNLASPSTIGVTGGASFVGYLTLVAFPAYSYLLPVGSIVGAFVTTMLIYALAYQKGVSPVRMILSGMAVSALFGAFNDIIKTLFAESLGNASGFLVGSDYRYLFPASIFLGFSLIVICDTIGRVIMPPGEVPVSIIISFIGAPFFLFLLRSRGKDGN